MSLRKFLAKSAESPPSVGRRFELSPFGPRMYFVLCKWGTALGVIATHIDDVSGRGEPDLLLEERLGKLAAEEGSFAHVGMAPSQEEEFPAKGLPVGSKVDQLVHRSKVASPVGPSIQG